MSHAHPPRSSLLTPVRQRGAFVGLLGSHRLWPHHPGPVPGLPGASSSPALQWVWPSCTCAPAPGGHGGSTRFPWGWCPALVPCGACLPVAPASGTREHLRACRAGRSLGRLGPLPGWQGVGLSEGSRAGSGAASEGRAALAFLLGVAPSGSRPHNASLGIEGRAPGGGTGRHNLDPNPVLPLPQCPPLAPADWPSSGRCVV